MKEAKTVEELTTEELKLLLKQRTTVLEEMGGRGVELAEEIDELQRELDSRSPQGVLDVLRTHVENATFTGDLPGNALKALDGLISKEDQLDFAVTAAMLVDGLRDFSSFAYASGFYPGGRIEMVSELVRYAPLCDKLAQVGFAVADEYPGVYAYEVAADFGTWWGQQLLSNRQAPDEATSHAKLAELAYEFFAQAGLAAGDSDRLKMEINAAAQVRKPGMRPV